MQNVEPTEHDMDMAEKAVATDRWGSGQLRLDVAKAIATSRAQGFASFMEQFLSNPPVSQQQLEHCVAAIEAHGAALVDTQRRIEELALVLDRLSAAAERQSGAS